MSFFLDQSTLEQDAFVLFAGIMQYAHDMFTVVDRTRVVCESFIGCMCVCACVCVCTYVSMDV